MEYIKILINASKTAPGILFIPIIKFNNGNHKSIHKFIYYPKVHILSERLNKTRLKREGE